MFDAFHTWSSDSKKLRMVAGMIPLMPPPSMLRMVIRFPKVGACIWLIFDFDFSMNTESCWWAKIWIDSANLQFVPIAARLFLAVIDLLFFFLVIREEQDEHLYRGEGNRPSGSFRSSSWGKLWASTKLTCRDFDEPSCKRVVIAANSWSFQCSTSTSKMISMILRGRTKTKESAGLAGR